MKFFWFRRDLRLNDNAGLYHALREGGPVLPVFIFDAEILEKLEDNDDRRVQFIYQTVEALKAELREKGSDLLVIYGKPLEVWAELITKYKPTGLFLNHDYEPSAIRRDAQIEKLCKSRGVAYSSFKDQVIFEKDEIVTEARKPYTVYTPYKKKWLVGLSDFYLESYSTEHYFQNFQKIKKPTGLLKLQEIGFRKTEFAFPPAKVRIEMLKRYSEDRDFPALEGGTSHLGLHLRFGTLSVRELARIGRQYSPVWLSELVWREFFMQVLYHFPAVEKRSFRPEYEKVAWRKSQCDFERWCQGMTGYPLVDAGMRELNATGFMHNRVRMVTASFLTKHLLIHWYQGERYFARRLLDYELASNNGNWQWAAGTGCDAAPYFRVFNPQAQLERFDKNAEYVRKWIPEFGTSRYPEPIVNHTDARLRALDAFKRGLKRQR